MEVKILEEAGYVWALKGLGRSFDHREFTACRPSVQRTQKLHKLAVKLAPKNGGHNKFLESIKVWIDVNMPRYWWQQFDTYRLMTKQSDSTMHTFIKRGLTSVDFMPGTSPSVIGELNRKINLYKKSIKKEEKEEIFKWLIRNKPEGLLQGRTVCTDYKTLANIISQRKGHKLSEEWSFFINSIKDQIAYVDLLPFDYKKPKLCSCKDKKGCS
jgi:hypothetical protein